jgi:hypothetical protein
MTGMYFVVADATHSLLTQNFKRLISDISLSSALDSNKPAVVPPFRRCFSQYAAAPTNANKFL